MAGHHDRRNNGGQSTLLNALNHQVSSASFVDDAREAVGVYHYNINGPSTH